MKRKIIVSSKTLKFRNALRDVCKAKRKEMTNLIIQLLDIVDDYYQGNAIVSPSELLNHIGLDASYEDDLIHLYKHMIHLYTILPIQCIQRFVRP
jgi:hypothetical protein